VFLTLSEFVLLLQLQGYYNIDLCRFWLIIEIIERYSRSYFTAETYVFQIFVLLIVTISERIINEYQLGSYVPCVF
jgi:hypothetical protein